MPSKLLRGLLVCAIVLPACSREQFEHWSSLTQELTQGQLSGPEDNGVVKLESLSKSGLIWTCSGVLVAPNLVVTARHCITDFVDGYWTCDSNGNLTSSGAGQMGVVDNASDITIRSGQGPTTTKVAKGAAIFTPQVSTICMNDIAFVKLDTQLTNLPFKPIRLTMGTFPGEQIRVLGYGTDGDSGTSSNTRRERSGITIAQVGPSDFRPAGDPIAPRTFVTLGSAMCAGDSGGPALSDADAVVGVFSQLVGGCTSPDAKNVYTQIAPFMADVALPAFAAAGYEPWLEGNSEPGIYGTGGASGTGGANGTGGAPSAGGDTSTQSETGGSNTAAGGAPIGTGGDTSGPAVYDQGPPSGGSCACRMATNRRAGLSALLAIVVVIGLMRRRLPA